MYTTQERPTDFVQHTLQCFRFHNDLFGLSFSLRNNVETKLKVNRKYIECKRLDDIVLAKAYFSLFWVGIGWYNNECGNDDVTANQVCAHKATASRIRASIVYPQAGLSF